MSKRAEEVALKVYPVHEDFYRKDGVFRSEPFDINIDKRYYFRQGYEQAEKDIIFLLESRIKEIIGDAQPNPVLRIELQGIIDKIK